MESYIKPTASLSSSLLARKGQARPAMRPQGLVSLNSPSMVHPDALDDLGWNDLGGDLPPVVGQQQALEGLYAPPAPVGPAAEQGPGSPEEKQFRNISSTTAARIGREVQSRRSTKAAFTLRLDQERHLKLRLAAAVTGQSAQQLVTQAMDEFLATLPELDALIDQLPAGKARGTERN